MADCAEDDDFADYCRCAPLFSTFSLRRCCIFITPLSFSCGRWLHYFDAAWFYAMAFSDTFHVSDYYYHVCCLLLWYIMLRHYVIIIIHWCRCRVYADIDYATYIFAETWENIIIIDIIFFFADIIFIIIFIFIILTLIISLFIPYVYVSVMTFALEPPMPTSHYHFFAIIFTPERKDYFRCHDAGDCRRHFHRHFHWCSLFSSLYADISTFVPWWLFYHFDCRLKIHYYCDVALMPHWHFLHYACLLLLLSSSTLFRCCFICRHHYLHYYVPIDLPINMQLSLMITLSRCLWILLLSLLRLLHVRGKYYHIIIIFVRHFHFDYYADATLRHYYFIYSRAAILRHFFAISPCRRHFLFRHFHMPCLCDIIIFRVYYFRADIIFITFIARLPLLLSLYDYAFSVIIDETLGAHYWHYFLTSLFAFHIFIIIISHYAAATCAFITLLYCAIDYFHMRHEAKTWWWKTLMPTWCHYFHAFDIYIIRVIFITLPWLIIIDISLTPFIFRFAAAFHIIFIFIITRWHFTLMIIIILMWHYHIT